MGSGRAQPAPVPPAMLHLGRWLIAGFVVTLIGMVPLFAFLGRPGYGPTHRWTSVLLPQVSFVPWIATSVMVLRGRRRIRRAYGATSGRMCTWCLYNLNGLGETGTCPECRREFDIERDRESWKRAGMGR